MNDRIRELLEKAQLESGNVDIQYFPAPMQRCQSLIDQALALLKPYHIPEVGKKVEKPCDTCEVDVGYKRIGQFSPCPDCQTCGDCKYEIIEGKPCEWAKVDKTPCSAFTSKNLDCQKSKAKDCPPSQSSEFVKRFRALLATQDKTVVVQDAYAYKACDIIDKAEAEIQAGKELWQTTQKARKRLAIENERFRTEDEWKDIVHNQTNKIILLEAKLKETEADYKTITGRNIRLNLKLKEQADEILDSVTKSKIRIGLMWAKQQRKVHNFQKGTVDIAIEDGLTALKDGE